MPFFPHFGHFARADRTRPNHALLLPTGWGVVVSVFIVAFLRPTLRQSLVVSRHRRSLMITLPSISPNDDDSRNSYVSAVSLVCIGRVSIQRSSCFHVAVTSLLFGGSSCVDVPPNDRARWFSVQPVASRMTANHARTAAPLLRSMLFFILFPLVALHAACRRQSLSLGR